MKRVKQKIVAVPEREKVVSFETFKRFGQYEIGIAKRVEPSCFNGEVSVTKYRITIEEIEESIEAYTERLQKLWEESDNHHDWQPLKYEAEKKGVVLIGSRGAKRKR